MPDSPTKGIGKWISIIHRKTQIHMNQAVGAFGLNTTESLYIIHLQKDKCVSRKWLTEHLSMDDALTTRTLRNLEERGFVVQARSETDQRALSVRLTEEGAALIPNIHAAHRAWLEELARDFSRAEILQAAALIQRMADRAIEATERKGGE